MKAPAEGQQVGEQQAGDEGVGRVQPGTEVRQEGEGQGHHRHPPGQLLAAGEVARDLEQGEAGEEHHGP